MILNENLKKNVAASKIQSLFKGFKARKKYKIRLNRLNQLKIKQQDLKKKLQQQKSKKLLNLLDKNTFLQLYYKKNKKEIINYCKKVKTNFKINFKKKKN